MIEAVPVLVAAAVLIAPTGSARHRLRVLRPRSRPRQRVAVTAWALPLAVGSVAVQVFGLVMGVLIGLAAALAARRWSALMERRRERTDPLVLAAGWDLLAAGMRAGLPVPVVVRAVAEELTGSARRTLREVAAHLALGSDAVTSWEPALANPDTAELARAARRTARTGQGLAEVAAELAERARATVAEQAEARAQRAAVWISAPLGLCFLPAFLCLGVVPVVAGTLNRLAVPG
ncbi:Type II secretion system (T2SS), protein F [Saccharopolyspora kobensis]|uniref:Type II secretion system (T2SS), protein F n=1 Tax=Saccharopolyspora kobensis TaxID=146035 RepID=A0A1H6DBC9_9PSEU|nr:type II secretion system F family protein [Saccharopolyspora kobensis]SEG82621.1 Type II secretion system (T2SS), protein F [Saccharopolyspora kobensis]SFE25270.1 Type II secretion system (T2SS), protein F [Saccharopolyspora kobensis]